MNKKILAVIIAVIVIVGISGVAYVVLNSSPARITITYTSTHGTEDITASNYPLIDKIGYNGIATWIVFNLNITTTKSTAFNMNNCSIKCDSQSLIVMNENALVVNLQSGQINSGTVDFLIEGNVTGNFQLGYNGTADVDIVD